MKRLTALVFIIAIFVFGGSICWGDGFNRHGDDHSQSGRFFQQGGGRPHGGPPSGLRGRDPLGIGRLEKFRIAKMIELLELTDEQQEQLIPEFRTMRRELRKLHYEKREHVVALTHGIRYEKITEEQINEHIAAIERINSEIPRFSGQFIEKVRTFLTTEQVGKFVLFAEKFDLLLLDRVRGFHERSMMDGGQTIDDSN